MSTDNPKPNVQFSDYAAAIRDIYETYAPAMACVQTVNFDDTECYGSAYHIGEGLFVTARHLVIGARTVNLATTVNCRNRHQDNGFWSGETTVKKVFYHPDPEVDVAIIKADRFDQPSGDQLFPPIVPLGSHLDDWLDDGLTMTPAVVFGYPPMSLSKRGPLLIAAAAEVNAVIDRTDVSHPHFLLSCMARGGFSGGLPFSYYGFSLGVITESIKGQFVPPELGFLAAISVEPILVCLAENEIMPKCVNDIWKYDDGTSLWDRRQS